MRYSKFFTNSLSLCIIPSLVAHPLDDIPNIHIPTQRTFQSNAGGLVEINNEQFSYDDILELIEEIESGDIEESCAPEEIDGINRFIAMLASQGILPGDTYQEFVLNGDIQELLSKNDNDYRFAYSLDGGYSIEPAVFYGQANGILCKSWVKKQWDHTRKFVKKHKKEIIIGVAIVVAVAVTVTVIVIVCSSSAAATAVGSAAGATAGACSGDSSQSQSNSSGSSENIAAEPEPQTVEASPIPNNEVPQIIEVGPIPINEVPLLSEVISEQVNEFKNHMAAESLINPDKSLDPESPSFTENARKFGIVLAHKAFEEVAGIVSVVPQGLEEIREIGELFIPSSICDFQPDDLFNPLGNFEDRVDKGHEAIDHFFGVDQSHAYVRSSGNQTECAIGILPPPSFFGSLVATEGRVAATQVSSTCGWRVGQPIQNRTFWGGVPKWSTVRGRYWKNEAYLNKSSYRQSDLERMQRGLAPQRINKNAGQIESMELHHIPSQKDGGLFDFIKVWPEEHANIDPNRYLGR